MKKFLVMACFLVISMQIKAQKTVDIGLRGGLAIPNIVATGGNPLSEGYTSRFALAGGILTEIGLSDLFSVRVGVEYSGQGGKRDGVQAMSTNQMVADMMESILSSPNGAAIPPELITGLTQMAGAFPIFYADVQNTAKFDYLMVPISVQVGKNLGSSPCRLYVNAGPFVSFLMSGEQISKGSTKLYTSPDKTATFWDILPPETQAAIGYVLPEVEQVLKNGTEFGTSTITGELRSVNVGVQGNVGLSYKCGDRNHLFIEAGGNFGFVPIQKDKSNGTNRLGSANVMVGYAHRIMN